MADPTAPYGKEARLPAIPDIRTGDVNQILANIKEWIEVRQGARGDGLDRVVTVRDLLNTGTVSPRVIENLVDGIPPIPLLPGDNDPAIPPTPTDLAAAGAISTIILTWNFARGYSRLAHFEVWRNTVDALGTAVLVAQVFEPMYSDEVGPNSKYYYWVRAVSDAGTSPFNAVAGTLGETAMNVQEVIDAITGEINDSGLLDQLTVKVDNNGKVSGYGLASTPAQDDGSATTFAILANRFLVAAPTSAGIIDTPPFTVQTTPTTVNGVAVPKGAYITDAYIMNGVITNVKIGNLAVDDAKISNVSVTKLTAGKLSIGAYIESTNYASGDTGFLIHANGNAEFNNATVRGTVYATAGLIGNVQIQANSLRSSNYNGSTAGWEIRANGSVTFTDGTFRGNVQATSGTIGGIEIGSNYIRSTNFSTGVSGWRLQSNGAAEFQQGTFRGSIKASEFMTGSYASYDWPPLGQSGTYLGPEGLLLGNLRNGKWVEITSEGNFSAPGLSITNGAMTIDAINVIDTLQIRGEAVTIPRGMVMASATGLSMTSPGTLLMQTSAFNPQEASVSLVVTITVRVHNAANDFLDNVGITIFRGSTAVKSFSTGSTYGPMTVVTVSHLDTPPAGTHTYYVHAWAQVGGSPSSGSPATAVAATGVAIGCKR